MHSGTTLLSNILANNSHVFSSGGETKFFDFARMIHQSYPLLDNDNVREYVDFIVHIISRGFPLGRAKCATQSDAVTSISIEEFMSHAKNHRDHADIFRSVFNVLTNHCGKDRWLEKTPSHIFHVVDIVNVVPDALFVEIVRDPRDVLASKKTRRQTLFERYATEQRLRKQYEKSYDPFWDTLSWKSAIRAGLQAKSVFCDRVLTVRYEDLVLSPRYTVQVVCDFLGMGFEESMLDVSFGNPADWQKDRQRGIRYDSVGRWQYVLRSEEIVLCQWLASSEMRAHGYDSTQTRSSSALNFFALYCNSSIEFLSRLYGRWRFGGARYLSNVICNYVRRLFALVAR